VNLNLEREIRKASSWRELSFAFGGCWRPQLGFLEGEGLDVRGGPIRGLAGGWRSRTEGRLTRVHCGEELWDAEESFLPSCCIPSYQILKFVT
jgi:hypothetical protein